MKDKILAFGEVMMRLQVPAHKKLTQGNTLTYSFSGTGVNVLSGLSQYGFTTELVTKLPSHSLGEAALAHIRSLGISSNHILRGGEYVGMYFLEVGFGARGSQVTYTNRQESSFCTSTIEEYDLDKIFQGVQLIHFCGIGLAVAPNIRKAVITLAKEAKQRGIFVCFDCNYRPKLWESYRQARPYYEEMLAYADICLMTEKDAEFVLGMPTERTDQKEKIAELLPAVAAKYNITIIAGTIREVVSSTRQALTGFLVQDSHITYSRQHRLEIYDRIGSGDAYASGIIRGFLQQEEASKIVEFATATAVLAHTTYGDSAIASLKEIQSLVNMTVNELER